MLLLKPALYKAGFTISDLAYAIDISYGIVHNAVCKDMVPIKTRALFIKKVDAFLKSNKIEVEGVWFESANPNQTGSSQNTTTNEDQEMETVTMLSQASLKHFKLFRNPFINDIREAKDVYLNENTHYALASMRDAARNQGILAVVADSGAGKSVLRKQLIEDLKHDGDVSIIEPKIFDKTRVTASGLCDAIIADISDEAPKRAQEAKARQVERLLKTASQGNQRHVMIIEEAHDLTVPVLKYLKRFWELEDGFSKLLGIVLVGQTELGIKLNEGKYYSLREFIRRCAVIELEDLTHSVEGYLKHKFVRCGGDISKIMDADCLEAIKERLTRKQNQHSRLYPQIINNLVSRAMNLACDLGEPRVTAEIVKEC